MPGALQRAALVLALVCALVLAGCGGAPGGVNPAATTTGPTDGTPGTNEVSGVSEDPIEHDLIVSNERNATVNVSLAVHRENGSDVYEDALQIASDERVKRSLNDTDGDAYVVTATVGDRTERYEYEASTRELVQVTVDEEIDFTLMAA